MDEIRTGGGASVGGDVDTGGGDVTGRDQANVTVNVQQPGPPYYPDYYTSQPGGLSVADATRLDTELRDLRKIVGDMNANVVLLRAHSESQERIVDKLTERSQAQDRVVDRLTDALREQLSAVTTRLNELEDISRTQNRQRGKRDPLQIIFGVIVIGFMGFMAVAIIMNGGL